MFETGDVPSLILRLSKVSSDLTVSPLSSTKSRALSSEAAIASFSGSILKRVGSVDSFMGICPW